MNRNRLYYIVILMAMTLAAPIQAATSYYCDFETPEMRERWVLNPTATTQIDQQLKNRWYIGEPGTNGKGTLYGLYISDDDGMKAHYSNNACMTVAYDTVRLDHLSADGDYILSFDYCGMGNISGTNKTDGLYVLWIPETEGVMKSNSTFSGDISDEYQNYLLPLQPKAGMDNLNGASTWKQCLVTIPNKSCYGDLHYLVFVWANGSHTTVQPGGKIDNIAIMDTRPCDAPTNVKVNYQGTTTTVSWSGTVTEYEVNVYSYESEQWYGPKTVTGTSTTFGNLPMGQADFIVRAKCAEDLFSLKTSISDFVYFPDEECIPFLLLDASNCYVADKKVSGENWMQGMTWSKGYINYGEQSVESRHTKHFRRDEYDPRTAADDGTPGLRTVPDGEIASVRLGNWKTGSEAERIEFKYHVDARSSAVMMLKYAIVLEKPQDGCKPNPGFLLRVLDKNKNLISDCASADFDYKAAAASGDPSWHESHPGSSVVKWKDWTPVGVNLTEYDGQDLTVQLTSYDCGGGGHYGYSYFTLHCSDGKFKGMKCGEINPVFEAPDGFVYRWAYASSEKYREEGGKMPEEYVLGHDQIFEAGMHDDSLYVVDCMFVQDSSCFFSLYASTLATNPIAVMDTPVITKNCEEGKYTLYLNGGKSWVQEIDHVKGDTLESKIYHIDRYEWNITGPKNFWSDEVSPVFTLPASGGDYTIEFRTACGTCDSTIYYTLHLDSLGATRDTTTMVLCDEIRRNGYVWAEKPDTVYKDYGMDSVVLFSETTSCDSIIYLNLTAPVREYVDTLVLPKNLPFLFRDRSYSVTMIDTVPVSATNCDTTWILNFEVYEALQAYMPDSVYFLCEDDNMLSIVYAITHGRSLRYSYAFSDGALPSITPVSEIQKKGQETLNIPFNPMPQANVYYGTLLLEDSIPDCNVTLPFTLTVNYASSVITQRWNDVLAIRNTDFNGGYTFDSVQWYMGETPIEGATEFNYYAGEGNTLRFNEPYRALLYRSDGVKLFTCPFMPTQLDKSVVNDMPTLVPLGAPLHIQGKGTARWMDILGRTEHSETYDNSTITTPASAGYYLLLLQGDEKRSTHSILCR